MELLVLLTALAALAGPALAAPEVLSTAVLVEFAPAAFAEAVASSGVQEAAPRGGAAAAAARPPRRGRRALDRRRAPAAERLARRLVESARARAIGIRRFHSYGLVFEGAALEAASPADADALRALLSSDRQVARVFPVEAAAARASRRRAPRLASVDGAAPFRVVGPVAEQLSLAEAPGAGAGLLPPPPPGADNAFWVDDAPAGAPAAEEPVAIPPPAASPSPAPAASPSPAPAASPSPAPVPALASPPPPSPALALPPSPARSFFQHGPAFITGAEHRVSLPLAPGGGRVTFIPNTEWAAADLLTGVTELRRNFGLTGAGVRIGIIDTGIDYTHPAFGGCTAVGQPAGRCRVVAGRDLVGDAFVSGKDVQQPDDDPLDCHNSTHGTTVAGIAAAGWHPGAQMLGVAPQAELAIYKEPYLSVMQRVYDLGILATKSAGNQGGPSGQGLFWVDAYTGAGSITVGSADTSSGAVGELLASDFSTYGPDASIALLPHLAAPGANVLTTTKASLGDGHTVMSGTSHATPYVSGGLALLLQLERQRAELLASGGGGSSTDPAPAPAAEPEPGAAAGEGAGAGAAAGLAAPPPAEEGAEPPGDAPAADGAAAGLAADGGGVLSPTDPSLGLVSPAAADEGQGAGDGASAADAGADADTGADADAGAASGGAAAAAPPGDALAMAARWQSVWTARGVASQGGALPALLATATPVASDYDWDAPAPVAKSGAGLVNFASAFFNPIRLTPPYISLPSGLNGSHTVTLTLTNVLAPGPGGPGRRADREHTFAVSHRRPAVAARISNEWGTMPLNLRSGVGAQVTVAPNVVTVRPGETVNVTVTFVLSDAARRGAWLYSGYIDLKPLVTNPWDADADPWATVDGAWARGGDGAGEGDAQGAAAGAQQQQPGAAAGEEQEEQEEQQQQPRPLAVGGGAGRRPAGRAGVASLPAASSAGSGAGRQGAAGMRLGRPARATAARRAGGLAPRAAEARPAAPQRVAGAGAGAGRVQARRAGRGDVLTALLPDARRPAAPAVPAAAVAPEEEVPAAGAVVAPVLPRAAHTPPPALAPAAGARRRRGAAVAPAAPAAAARPRAAPGSPAAAAAAGVAAGVAAAASAAGGGPGARVLWSPEHRWLPPWAFDAAAAPAPGPRPLVVPYQGVSRPYASLPLVPGEDSFVDPLTPGLCYAPSEAGGNINYPEYVMDIAYDVNRCQINTADYWTDRPIAISLSALRTRPCDLRITLAPQLPVRRIELEIYDEAGHLLGSLPPLNTPVFSRAPAYDAGECAAAPPAARRPARRRAAASAGVGAAGRSSSPMLAVYSYCLGWRGAYLPVGAAPDTGAEVSVAVGGTYRLVALLQAPTALGDREAFPEPVYQRVRWLLLRRSALPCRCVVPIRGAFTVTKSPTAARSGARSRGQQSLAVTMLALALAALRGPGGGGGAAAGAVIAAVRELGSSAAPWPRWHRLPGTRGFATSLDAIPPHEIEEGLPEVTAWLRSSCGTNYCSKLRKGGHTPCVLFSLPGNDSLPLAMDSRDAERLVREFGRNGLQAQALQLNIIAAPPPRAPRGQAAQQQAAPQAQPPPPQQQQQQQEAQAQAAPRAVRVLAKAVHVNSVTLGVENVRFLFCPRDRTVTVDVPVRIWNADVAPGVKAGGWLHVVNRTVPLRAPGGAVPRGIELDMRGMRLKDVLRLADVPLPPGVALAARDARQPVVRNMAAPEPTPGFRAQAATAAGLAKDTLSDKEKRDALAAEVAKHASELAALAKQTMADAEKRQKLLDYAKAFAAQATAAAKDPHQRSALLDKLKATTATLQEIITDPAKRQEVHDQLAATTHSLLQSASAPPAAAAAAPAAPPAAQ
ncbi:rplY [Scenedesmus sp. PABB004]|nr:rplY [Scenedesmus sp. PABB004]